MNHEYYMKLALQEAKAAYEEGEIPVGAVVVCQGHVIARAHNLCERLKDVTAHAEMQAITAAATELGGKYLNDCTLYVSVEPCTMSHLTKKEDIESWRPMLCIRRQRSFPASWKRIAPR